MALAVLAAVACAPRPGQPAFPQSALWQPFEDGAVLRWADEIEGREFTYRLRETSAGYELWGPERIEHFCEFIALRETAEDDYIAQCYIPSEDMGDYYYYAVWRDGEMYGAQRVWGRTAHGLMHSYRQDIYAKVRAAAVGTT